MMRSADEPFTLYGLIAQSIETDAARDHVTFRLDPRAHFSDGGAITSADVAFTFKLLKEKGRPQQRAALGLVKSVETPDALTVRCDLTRANDRELPMTLGLMPVLSRAHTDAEHFDEQTLQIPISSGPYVVAEVKPGERLTLKRDPNYWARDLPINRGLYNFDEIRIDYYRDATAMFEAFKAGLYDFRIETDPTRWRTGYDFPALRDGRIVKQSVANGLPKGMEGFAFNTRRPLFADPRVREALAMMFDFEWINANLYGGAYRRSKSFFDDSELSSAGRPASPAERALLAPFPGAVRADVMEGQWSPPVSDGSGRDRRHLRDAIALFAAAGYELNGTTLRERASGKPFAFEIMVASRDEERLALAFSSNLARAGIEARIRLLDAVQYDQRRLSFDFDMIENRWEESLSPGNEQSLYWGSAAAGEQGSRNYMGVRSPAVDGMIAALLLARERVDFVAAVRALDRLLISGCYVVPLFYLPQQWVARWATIAHPARTSLFGYLPETWWHEPKRTLQ
jgi:peptide/nickel transport system substrate-binding protein